MTDQKVEADVAEGMALISGNWIKLQPVEGNDGLFALANALLGVNSYTQRVDIGTQCGVYDALGQLIVRLPHVDHLNRNKGKDAVVVYNNGCIIYKGNDYPYQQGFGAIDLTGRIVVPFVKKSVAGVLKSKEWAAYTPSDEALRIAARAARTGAFIKFKSKLDAYRCSRFSALEPLNIRQGKSPCLSVGGNDKQCAVYDRFLNAITDQLQYRVTNGLLFSHKSHLICLNPKDKAVDFYDLTGKKRYTNQCRDYVVLSHYLDYDYGDGYDRRIFNGTFAPKLAEFVSAYVNRNMKAWYLKDEFELSAEYQARTTPAMCEQAQEYFAQCALTTYRELWLGMPFTLSDYDRENEAFLLESEVGNVILPVPFSKSMDFRNAWEKGEVDYTASTFTTVDDGGGVTLQELILGKDKSTYAADREGMYTRYLMAGQEQSNIPMINVVPNNTGINTMQVALNNHLGKKKAAAPSDVDLNIPRTGRDSRNTFALIIANENYARLSDVDFAANDGKIFAEYCRNTLGLPTSNVRTYTNATYGKMMAALSDINNIANAYDGAINLIVYYAGHGAPLETTRAQYLLPVDAETVDPRFCLSLEDFYAELAKMPTQSTMVFVDACFTGSERTEQSGKMLIDGRVAEIESEDAAVPSSGNMVVFTASSGRQTAIPDRENSHGLFTYYLLKKIRTSRGNLTAGELWDYLQTEVSRRSAVIGKVQTPTVAPSANIATSWRRLTL